MKSKKIKKILKKLIEKERSINLSPKSKHEQSNKYWSIDVENSRKFKDLLMNVIEYDNMSLHPFLSNIENVNDFSFAERVSRDYKEINELHEDKKMQAKKFATLEEFVVEALSNEIAEFYEDKKDLAETKVRLIKEANSHFVKVKKDFRKV